MDAGVVDQHLNGALFQDCGERPGGGVGIGDVETDCLGGASRAVDCLYFMVRPVQVAIGVHHHMQPVCRELPADGCTNGATSPGHQCSFHLSASIET